MHRPDPVETILARLMPSAMSESGQRGIETMLDELAGELAGDTPARETARPVAMNRRLILGSIAAAGVAVVVLLHLVHPSDGSTQALVAPAKPAPTRVVLVGESDRVESMADVGWREDSDGSAMRAVRLNVVAENSVLDEETGIVMQVSEPREEVLLMPVSAF